MFCGRKLKAFIVINIKHGVKRKAERKLRGGRARFDVYPETFAFDCWHHTERILQSKLLYIITSQLNGNKQETKHSQEKYNTYLIYETAGHIVRKKPREKTAKLEWFQIFQILLSNVHSNAHILDIFNFYAIFLRLQKCCVSSATN